MKKEAYTPERVVNRFFMLAWVIAFTLQMGQNIYNYSITTFANTLGMSNALAGLIAIPYLLLAILGRVVGGMVCDRLGRRYGMLLGAGAFLIGSVLYCTPVGALIPMVFLGRGLHGFGYAVCSTAYSVVVVDVTPKEKSALGIGINWTAQGIAQAVGGILIAILIVGDQFMPLFLSATIFLAVSVIAAFLCRYESGRPEKTAPREKDPLLRRMVEKEAIPHALVVLVNYFAICLSSFYSASYARRAGIPGGGYFYTACACTMVLANLSLPRLEKRFGTIPVLLPCFALSVVGVINMAFAATMPRFLLSGLIYGVSIGTMPIFQNNTVKNLRWDRRGAGTSTLFLSMDLAMGVGPVIWGAILDQLGYTAAAFFAAGVFVLAAVLTVITQRNTNRGERV